MQGSLESYNSKLIATATTTLVETGPGTLGGIFVSSSTAGTIAIYDGITAAGTKLVDTTTVAVGWYKLPFGFATGLTVVTTGTISCSVAYI